MPEKCLPTQMSQLFQRNRFFMQRQMQLGNKRNYTHIGGFLFHQFCT